MSATWRDRSTDNEKGNLYNVFIENTALKTKSAKSAAVTLTSQVVLYILQVGSAVVLARLLTPDDYGLIAMVTSITLFARLFKDLGLSSATVQKERISHHQISTLYWINVLMGFAITIVVAAISPVVAWFYGESILTKINLVLSTTFLISSFGAQHSAILTRQMRFKALSIIRITSMLIRVLVSIVFALHIGNYWALVSGVVAESFVSTIGLWIVSDFRPGMPVRGSGIREMLKFGANITGFGIANYFHRNLDKLLIGKVWGSTQLGLYNRAYSLLMLPITNLRGPLNRVAFPALSRLQNDAILFRSFFIRYISILAFLSMPIVGFIFINSRELILVLLGDQWIAASEIFSILALGAIIQPVASLRGLVLMSTGQGRKYLYWGIINTIIVAIAFSCGLPWGARGVAAGYVIANYIILHPSLIFAFKNSPLKPTYFYQGIYKSAICTGTMCFVIYIFREGVSFSSSIANMALYGVVSLMIFLLVFIVIPGGRQEIRGHFNLIVLIFRSDITDNNHKETVGICKRIDA